ncbi:T9SS type A sorting domain-containing protein, partial [candidate division KSB1 bacterium]|nr:T9SS type A sorting domain-containing protein [candidate division KSB1 bacterium]
KHWQICNQLLDACADDCRDTYAQKYSEVLRLAYRAVKEADSTAQVLIAGDSHMTEYPSVFNELNGKYTDIVDMHRFGDESQYNPKEHLDYIKNALSDAGYNLDNTRIWITETGTYSGDPVPRETGTGVDLPFQNEKQQAGGLLKYYVSAFSHGIEKVFWAWNIVEGFQRNGSIFDYNGLIYDGYEWTGNSSNDPNGRYSNDPTDIVYDKGSGVKKLAYYTYKLMVDKLENGNWDNLSIVSNGSNNIYVYKFNITGDHIWILWWDWYNDPDYSDGETISFDLSVGKADSVMITESIPNADSGDEIQEDAYPAFFFTRTEKVNDETAEITLGNEPVYVERTPFLTSIGSHGESNVSQEDICLYTGYPNPFNSQTQIRYNLQKSSNVTLNVYNVSGQQVATLVDEFQTAGEHKIMWEAKGLPSGLYIGKLNVGVYSETIKLMLQK